MQGFSSFVQLIYFKGWRVSMEDSHIADIDSLGKNISIFGVFDGHGGSF
jgi:serine/threonine protein phosphatase PrpC